MHACTLELKIWTDFYERTFSLFKLFFSNDTKKVLSTSKTFFKLEEGSFILVK
jgi:hypothetical protein